MGEKLHAIFSGKHGKIFLIAVGVIALVAFIMSRKKAAAPTDSLVSSYPGGYQTGTTSGGGAGGGVSQADMSAAVTGLSQSMTDNMKKMQEQEALTQQQTNKVFGDALTGVQSSFGQMFGAYSHQMDATLASFQDGVNHSLLTAAAQNANMGHTAPVVEGFGGSAGVFTPVTLAPAAAPSSPAFGYGDHGTPQQQQQYKESMSSYKTDRAALDTEIARTGNVMNQLGMTNQDTRAAEAHMANLQKLKKAG